MKHKNEIVLELNLNSILNIIGRFGIALVPFLFLLFFAVLTFSIIDLFRLLPTVRRSRKEKDREGTKNEIDSACRMTIKNSGENAIWIFYRNIMATARRFRFFVILAASPSLFLTHSKNRPFRLCSRLFLFRTQVHCCRIKIKFPFNPVHLPFYPLRTRC